MNVLFVLTEAGPFIKTGGLGEVGGSLPNALSRQQVNVRVMLPNYSLISSDFRNEMKHVADFTVRLGWRNQYCGIEEYIFNGIHYYFVDNEYYFKRDGIYGFYDEAERYAFFNKACLESLKHLDDFKPDIIHCHDWQTALVPLFLKESYKEEPYYYEIRTVFTIHNLKYQGIFPKEVAGDILGLKDEFLTEKKLEFHGAINYMKAALIYADRVTTVSPSYALEIQDSFFGEGLDGLLREKSEKLTGILNGIDYDSYNPENDPSLFVQYLSSLCRKEENKLELQRMLGLPVQADLPVLAMVSRLVYQKGLDLLEHILEEIMELDLQLVVLGTGEKKYEEMLLGFAARFPSKMAVRIGFDDKLARRIYAGADLLLMPSLFEPCGLAQMIAMRYSTIPIVRETGGLKDSVISFNKYTGEGNGFSFANYNAHELLFTIQEAVRLFKEDKITWKGLAENARKSDFSWAKSALMYKKLYESLQ